MSYRLPLPAPSHPALQAHAKVRRSRIQDRVADAITTFAGSMVFVYIHILAFAVWMLAFEKSPRQYPKFSR